MTVEQLNVIVTANSEDFNRKLSGVTSRLDEMQKTAKVSTANTLNSFKSLAAGIGALGIGKFIKDSITAGMDAIESDSLFETSLGKYADNARKWSEELGNSLGLNAVNTRKSVGTLTTMTKSMGIGEEKAIDMSKSLTLLAGDMASFYNISENEAFTKITAGITGETEPLKRLGILVDEATVKQAAYQKGIAELGTELTQQQKVLARYAAIMEQTSTAQGDLARTIDSPANQLRLLQNELLKTKQEIGAALMP